MKKIIADRFSERHKTLMVDASNLEKDTWEEQKREAYGWNSDNSYSTPIIDILSIGRNIEKTTFVNKVIEKVDSYNIKLGTLLLEQQLLKEKVNLCESIPDCHRLKHEKFGIALSRQQKEAEGIESTPLTLKMDF